MNNKPSHHQHPQPHPHPHPQPHPHPHPHPRPYRPPPKPKRTALASCIVGTIFLIFVIIILSIIYFSLFNPHPPTISVTAVTLPSFSLSSTSAIATVNFTFSLYAAVRNPNRAAFHHFDSSLHLLHAGNQVGFMFIPAGTIPAGRTEYMAATFSVESFPISASPAASIPPMAVVGDGVDRVMPTMEIESRMEMVGRTRVLWFFSHHLEAVADCRVAVAIKDGSVLGFHC